jgi:hypothetical protein
MKRIIATVLSLLLVTCVLAGCGEEKLKITDEEAFDVLSSLVPKSYEINEAFFGKGLPREDDAQYDKTKYVPVDLGKSAFVSIRSMKNAAEQVYSRNYLDCIYVIMFIGTESSESDGILYNDMSPSYKEMSGELCIDAAFKPDNILSRLDVISVKVSKRTAEYVSVDAVCRDESGAELNKTFYLTVENGVWLLDGPTY